MALRRLRGLRRRVGAHRHAPAPVPAAAPPAPHAGPFRTIYDWRPGIDESLRRRQEEFPEIQDPAFWTLYHQCKPYSMLHITGFYNLYQSVSYVVRNGVPGDLVECGSFLGGASIFMLLASRRLGDERAVHVFDTFAGFPPDSDDVRIGGEPAHGPSYPSFLESVRDSFRRETGPDSAVQLVEGDVATTLPLTPIERIALLRLDTDFHDSTRAELEHLYPRLVRGGAIIIDDYGAYEGARRATDEYFAERRDAPLLNRVDAAIWAGVKP